MKSAERQKPRGIVAWFRGQADPPAFRDELREQGPRMTRIASLLGIIAFGGMALVDPMMVEGEALRLTHLTRVITCGALLALIVATLFGDWARRYSRTASLAACIICGVSVIALSYLTGGTNSDYHQALLVVMFAFAVMPLDWSRYDAFVTFFLFVAVFDGALLTGDLVHHMGQFATHNAVLLAGFMVAAVFQRVGHEQRLREFLARHELAAANERLTALDMAKTRFFSNISHELRTPLTLIVAPLEALLESSREPLSEGQRERLRLAQRNALRLLRLVDDLLSLTRAEAASLKLHVKELDLADLVKSFVQDVEELAARKQLTVTVAVPERALIEGDATLIERIMLNVFGNAAKFVDRGGKVALTLEAKDDGFALAVADDGIGISKDNLPHIFDRFYQADSGSTRSHGGTGIGLALVKEIAELHGGRVWVESELGQGTTIHVWFPRALPASCESHVVRSREQQPEPQGLPEWHQAIRSARSYRLQGIDDATERRVAPRPRPRGDAPTILVVEDNPDMIRFLVALLAYDFNVLSAQNGKDGLRMALERRPDLVISDVMMPEMDGFEMARHLRQDENGAKIPLIFLTARGSSEDRIQGHSGGADTYLAKPFRSEELLAAVDALLSRQQRIRESETTIQDEAMVFMASGILEHVQRSLAMLVSVQGGLAQTGAPTDEQLQRFTQSIDKLAELVTGLRQLTAAATVKVVRPTPIDDALRTIAARVSETLPTGRTLHVELSTRACVHVSEEELGAVVRPLLERAVEVTPPGRNVFLQAVEHRASGGGAERPSVSVIIRDEGPSLTAGQIERLFFPFHSVDVEVGAALELARARRIVLARGGSISAEPESELGSRVTILLPAHMVLATEEAA